MNGDLSLSQSLGGLRIANPDEDEDTPTGHSISGQPYADNHSTNPSASSLHPTSDAPTNHSSSSYRYDARYESAPTHNEYSTDYDNTDAMTPGYENSSYSNQSQWYSSYSSSPHYSTHAADPLQLANHSLGHRQSMPLAQEAQQQPHYMQPNPGRAYNQPPISHRPMSGFYSHTNASSSSGHTTENSHQRVRAESTQSTNSAIRRSNSRNAPGAGYGRGDVRSDTRTALYRQTSNPVQPSPGYAPARRSSRINPGEQDSRYGPAAAAAAAAPSRPHASTIDNGAVPNNAESQERSAPNVQQATDQNGTRPSRPVKKGVRDFQFGRTLGEGSYSTVLAATDRQTHREFAIKVLDKRHIIKEKKVKYVNIERDTLNRLTDHPGIVRLYFTFQDERSLYFVLDLATGGELLGVLKKTTSFDEECTRFYSAQILDAIEYMHIKGVIHRDLKPENVLLDDQMHVKITDFGTAKLLDTQATSVEFGRVSVNNNNPLDGADTDRAVSFVGTAEYVSPELLTDKNACKASDLWAFGCIVYQLLAGRPPFKAGNEYQTFQKIVHLEYSFPEGFPSIAKDLVTRLLVLDPGERLPIDAIKRHPFFDGIQWGKGLWKMKAPRLKPFVPYGSGVGQDQGFSTSSDRLRDPRPPLPRQHSGPRHGPSASSGAGNGNVARPQPRIITELAPPSQLDIEWSPVLDKNNERILQLEQLTVYSTPAPNSPTSRNGVDTATETPSKFSRLFGASSTKKRKRLVMVTSSGRLILAPAEGDRKEAKVIIDLTASDVSWKSQPDQKGYTVWCINTRDKHMTFEDPRTNTGDSGSSKRSTQIWLDNLEAAKESALRQPASANPYGEDSYGDINQRIPLTPNASESKGGLGSPGGSSSHHQMRKTLRKEQSTEEDGYKSRKRFSRRHSKNGLTAVF